MSIGRADKLVMMANQIARNLLLESDPAGMTANHIMAFWSPQMRAQIIAHGGDGLVPAAREAIALVARRSMKNAQ